MLLIALDAVVLMFLLKTVNDEDIGFFAAIILALVGAIGTSIVAALLVTALGFFGVIVAALVAAALLGVAVSALYGVEIKRSLMIGGIFTVVHIAASIGLQWMFRV